MALAINLYQFEQDKGLGEKRRGLRTICKEAEKEFFKETKVSIHLNPSTLWSLAKGHSRPKREVNQERGWLSKGETDTVVDYLVETGETGFGLSHRRLKEHVDEVLIARLGNAFPACGVGQNWTHRFVERNNNRIQMYKAQALHDLRGKAANPETWAIWYDLVEETDSKGDDGKPIANECKWAVDETAFRANGSEGYEKVIGGAGKNIQYQQQAGSRENITVLVTIGANGTALAPAIIFAGKGYLIKWKQENPADALLGYSKKGWTDGEIGVEYAKHFEAQTRDIARGRTRLLYVDGHNSHYTRGFLVHCREHKIKVLCYPAHTTHIYQGLDVVVFSPLKAEYARRRDAHFRETGEPVSKENFLHIYGEAHLKVLTPEIIKTAFRKTGLVPVDRDVITPDMMAPSRDTAFRYYSPVEPSREVQIVTDLMVDVLQPGIIDGGAGAAGNQPPTARDTFPARLAIRELEATDSRFLVTKSPIKSSSNPPDTETLVLSPTKPCAHPKAKARSAINTSQSILRENEPSFGEALLTVKTQTPLEKQLQYALASLNRKYKAHKQHVAKLQSTLVLQRIYCRRLRSQLHAKEKKKEGKGKKGRLNGDGLPRLLTSPEFIVLVEEHQAAAEAEEEAKIAREKSKAEHEAVLNAWMIQEAERKARNVELENDFNGAVTERGIARLAAKAAKLKLKVWDVENPKPKKSNYLLPSIPRPVDPTRAGRKKKGSGESENREDEGEWTDEEDNDVGEAA